MLEKSPILESKLRKSSSSESGSDIPREASPPRKRLKASKPSEAQVGTGTKSVKSTKQQKEKEETPEMCSSPNKSVKANNPVLSPRPKSELSSPIPFLYSPEAIDYEAKSLEFRQMLSNVKYSYSFEVRRNLGNNFLFSIFKKFISSCNKYRLWSNLILLNANFYSFHR